MKEGGIRVEIADCLSPRPRNNRHRDKRIKAEERSRAYRSVGKIISADLSTHPPENFSPD
jgi:hypothetical protein